VRPHLASIRIISLIFLALIAQETPAAAQGIFGWFGGQRDDRYPQRQNSWGSERQNLGSEQRRDSWFGQERRLPPQTNAYGAPAPERSYTRAPERTSTSSNSSSSGGQYVAYCVRLCDGRYFPMQRHNNATSVQLCNAFCPATKTQVFNGSQIDHAVASNGARYTNLANAFVYREKIVPDCTCNGKDSFGLAKIDVKSDPTLRQGDIIATGDNQKAALAAAANRLATRNAMVEKAAALRTNSGKKAGAGASAESASDTDERPED
jgi:hypothetical protein